MTRVIRLLFFLIISTLLALLLLCGQTFALINYDLAVALGLQESVEEVTRLEVAWAKAFAIGDTVFYLPILIAGITGLSKRKKMGLLLYVRQSGSICLLANCQFTGNLSRKRCNGSAFG